MMTAFASGTFNGLENVQWNNCNGTYDRNRNFVSIRCYDQQGNLRKRDEILLYGSSATGQEESSVNAKGDILAL